MNFLIKITIKFSVLLTVVFVAKQSFLLLVDEIESRLNRENNAEFNAFKLKKV